MLWSTEYETGHAKIDEQHKRLFEEVEKLIMASGKKDSDETVLKTSMFMLSYAINHFSTEERLMLESDYPKYEEHKEQHNEFVGKATELVRLHNTDGMLSIENAIKSFVMPWLREHVIGRDKEMATHYKKWEEKETE